MFVPQSAIVTYTHLFPTHCTYEAGGARAPTPPACKFSSTACADRQAFTVHFPTTCSSATKTTTFSFSHGGHDKLEGPGGIMYRAHSSMSSAFSLTAPSHDAAEQSTAASAEPICFHSQRMTLSSFPCSNSIATRSTFLQGQIRNPLVFATALFTVVAHVLQRLTFEWLALRVL